MSIKKLNSRGFVHIAILIVLAVGIGGVAYWRLSSYNNDRGDNGSPGGATNTATLSEECVAKTGDPNICRLGAIADLSQFSSVVRMTMENENGSLTSVIKYDGKGNQEVEVGEDIRGITAGGKDYILMDGKWYETGSGSPEAPKAKVPSFGFATTAGIKYENLGKEPCGNATCFKYRMTGGILEGGVVTALFGDKDYLPRRIDSSGGFLGKLLMTVEYKDVTVSAPAGAQPISTLYEGMGN